MQHDIQSILFSFDSEEEENSGSLAPHGDQPAWDLGQEYDSFDDRRFITDLAQVKSLALEIESLEPVIAPVLERAEALRPEEEKELLASVRLMLVLSLDCGTLFSNLAVFANCVASVNGSDTKAKESRGILASVGARLEKAESVLDLLLARGSASFVESVISSQEGRAHAFRIRQLRKYKNRLLPLAEEKVVATLVPDGLKAWSTLYDAIASTAKCLLKTKEGEKAIGMAEAASLWRDSKPFIREAAWRAQSETFALHEESLAAILNSIAGWRLAEYELRSKKETVHFLDAALAQNRMSRKTLDAMLSVVAEAREIGREALQLQARLMGVPKLACWDILAPCPELPGRIAGSAQAQYSFVDGLALVQNAYGRVHKEMEDFVLEMRDKKRIEARILPTKRPGAYCTRFAKSRTSWVFQTYRGSLADVSTLAHELGHAYHGKLLRDLPLPETRYPMALAETASTFAETALGDYLEITATDTQSRMEIAWSDAQDAATFLINIPARFAFEKRYYELRSEKPLGAAALSELMRATWEEYYGDSLCEYDSGFWRSKLHFYMSGNSFYNFPYTFGYLFSLGVYARRQTLGSDFHTAYTALLRDTGRMETEELAAKHLDVDLTASDFWRASIGVVRAKVDRFAGLVSAIGR